MSHPARTHEQDDEAFFDKVLPEPMSGCWLWDASLTASGYGQVWYRSKRQVAHRASLAIAGVAIPDGMVVAVERAARGQGGGLDAAA